MNSKLSRHLRFWDSVAISVGIVIGVGIFRVPSQVTQFLHSAPLILFAWLIGGIIALLGVLCYAELSSRYPETGGTYVFLREAYGKFVAFLYGWAEFSINRAASIAAIAYIFAVYLRNLINFPPEFEKWIAVSAICFFTIVNILGVHFGVKVQNVLSFFKVIAMVLMAGLIFIFSKNVTHYPIFQFEQVNFGELTKLAPALIPILWTYGGWHETTFMAGEFHDTKKELPLSLIVGAVIVCVLYLLMNACYLKVIPAQEMPEIKAVAAESLKRVFGSAGSFAITVAILISASGALNSTILTGGRIPFAVAQDTQRMNWIGEVDKRFKTPLKSLVLNGIWASVLVIIGNFEQLLFFNAFEIWLFFILVGVSVFVLRRKFHWNDEFTMIGYPIVPALFTIVATWLCVTTILEAPKAALLGILLIMVGIPLYFFSAAKNHKSIV